MHEQQDLLFVLFLDELRGRIFARTLSKETQAGLIVIQIVRGYFSFWEKSAWNLHDNHEKQVMLALNRVLQQRRQDGPPKSLFCSCLRNSMAGSSLSYMLSGSVRRSDMKAIVLQ